MTQAVDLTLGGNNQNFFLPVDVSALAALYDVEAGTFRMQMRDEPSSVLPRYSWSSDPADTVPGAIEYNGSGLISIVAPYSDVRRYMPAGQYAYDLQWESDEPVPEYIVMNLWTGTLTVAQGVTLR